MKNRTFRRLTALAVFAWGAFCVNAQTLEQRASLNLQAILHELIKAPDVTSYDGLKKAYETTDVRPNGTLWDIYSNHTTYIPNTTQGNFSKEGDVYNREHTTPSSWFGGAPPMYSDLFNVYPSDGYINNRRSNYPYGEVAHPTYTSIDGCKLGPCVTPGYTGTVFEPMAEFKGDLARTYFYMVTCYSDKVGSWDKQVYGANDAFDGYVGYPGLQEWALKMFIRWAKEDPVSQKEIDRNNAVYKIQGNRNPFIDCPGLERFIWSDYVEQ